MWFPLTEPPSGMRVVLVYDKSLKDFILAKCIHTAFTYRWMATGAKVKGIEPWEIPVEPRYCWTELPMCVTDFET